MATQTATVRNGTLAIATTPPKKDEAAEAVAGDYQKFSAVHIEKSASRTGGALFLLLRARERLGPWLPASIHLTLRIAGSNLKIHMPP